MPRDPVSALRPKLLVATLLLASLGVIFPTNETWGEGLPGSAPEPTPLPGPTTPDVVKPEQKAPPNIVFILTDDLDMATMAQLPALKRSLGDAGTTFASHYVSLSLCCPSRVTILCGQYAHNTGIYGNRAPSGGYPAFRAGGKEDDTVAVWLQKAGYRTALLGKYLNGYPGKGGGLPVPPGWNEWASPSKGNAYKLYNYSMNENGKEVPYAEGPDDYLTSVIDRKAVQFIEKTTAEKVPFFLYLSVMVPHSPATPAPAHKGAFPDAKAPRGGAFDEADVSDKPSWLKDAPALNAKQLGYIDGLYRRRLQTMLSVEELVDDVLAALERTGQLDNTYVVFTSDNGFHLGEHRLVPGKNTAFETDIHVPLIVRGPGVAKGARVDALTGNVDFAPTFLALSGAPAEASVDGRSLVPLWSGGAEAVPWRQALLLEHAGPEAVETAGEEDGSGMLEPPDAPKKGAHNGTNGVPVFTGVRTSQYTWVRYAGGETELYDNLSDPLQLDNLAKTADLLLTTSLDAWTKALGTCAGEGCREVEMSGPVPDKPRPPSREDITAPGVGSPPSPSP